VETRAVSTHGTHAAFTPWQLAASVNAVLESSYRTAAAQVSPP